MDNTKGQTKGQHQGTKSGGGTKGEHQGANQGEHYEKNSRDDEKPRDRKKPSDGKDQRHAWKRRGAGEIGSDMGQHQGKTPSKTTKKHRQRTHPRTHIAKGATLRDKTKRQGITARENKGKGGGGKFKETGDNVHKQTHPLASRVSFVPFFNSLLSFFFQSPVSSFLFCHSFPNNIMNNNN